VDRTLTIIQCGQKDASPAGASSCESTLLRDRTTKPKDSRSQSVFTSSSRKKRQNAPKSDKNRTTTAKNGGNLEGGPKSELYTLRVDVKLHVYVRRLSSLCIFAPRNTAHDLTRNNGATCTRSCTRQPENEPENVRPGGSTNGAVGKVISTTLVYRVEGSVEILLIKRHQNWVFLRLAVYAKFYDDHDHVTSPKDCG